MKNTDMKTAITFLSLFAFATFSLAQVPNGNFEEWEIIDSIEQPQYWKTNNFLCCRAVEKTGDAIEGDYSMKISSTAPSIEGTLPGWAEVTFHPAQVYGFLNASLKIDSIEMGGSVVISVSEWANGTFQEIGNWEGTMTTNGIAQISIPLNHTQPDSLKINVSAQNTPGATWSIGYSEVIIDQLELSIISSTSNLEKTGDLFKIYPNPSGGVFYIKPLMGQEVKYVEIYDQQGKLLLHESDSGQIDISRFPDGIYSLMVHTVLGRTFGHIVQKKR